MDMEAKKQTNAKQANLQKTDHQTVQNAGHDRLSADGKYPHMTLEEFIEKGPSMTLAEVLNNLPANLSEEQNARCYQAIPQNLKNKFELSKQGIGYDCDCDCEHCSIKDRCFVTPEAVDALAEISCSDDDIEMNRLKAFFQASQSLSCEDLYEAYCDACYERDGNPIDERMFGKLISRHFPHIKRVRIRRNGKLTYVYKGATLKTDSKFFHKLFEKKKEELGLI
jgi:hypothetical protein